MPYTPTAPFLIKFNMGGSAELKRQLQNMFGTIAKNARAAIYVEAERIMALSKSNFVPIDEGPLMNSGRVEMPTQNLKEISVVLHYGAGLPRFYAEAVHEHPSEHTPPSWQGKDVKFKPPGRGPKYLELPMRQQFKGMSGRIKKAVFNWGPGAGAGVHVRHTGGPAIGQAPGSGAGVGSGSAGGSEA